MKIIIKEKELELKFRFKSMIQYEQIAGKTFQPKNFSDMLLFMYCIVNNSDKDFNIEYDEFLDWLDDNPIEIQNFSEWLTTSSSFSKSIYPVKDNGKGSKKK